MQNKFFRNLWMLAYMIGDMVKAIVYYKSVRYEFLFTHRVTGKVTAIEAKTPRQAVKLLRKQTGLELEEFKQDVPYFTVFELR